MFKIIKAHLRRNRGKCVGDFQARLVEVNVYDLFMVCLFHRFVCYHYKTIHIWFVYGFVMVTNKNL